MKLKICARSFLPIAVATFVVHLSAYAQIERKSSSKELGKSSNASCFDESSGRLVGPNNTRTFVLKSPDGNYRAYAETEAVTHKVTNAHGDESVECENTSRLFVAGPKSQKFRQVLIVSPSPELLGNSIDLVDWSPNGHRLLIAQGLWQYGSDFGETVVQIYDADSDKLSSKSLVDEAFRKHAGKDCVSVFQPAGFSPNGRVIVRAGPYFDVGEERSRADSCVPKEGLWLIGPPGPTVSRLSDNYKLQHYGRRVASALAE